MTKLITSSKAIAITSFFIGSTIFTLQLCFTNTYAFVVLGLLFAIVAVFINSISLVGLIYYLLGNSNSKKLELLESIGIVLLNIPIALLYFYILLNQ